MKSLYLFLLIISLLSILILYLNITIKDGFENNINKVIILLGDSMLNNSNYVDKDVVYNIKMNTDAYKIINNAKDNGKIKDIYKQLEVINENENIHKIFLSVGGNDIIESIFYMDSEYINKLFENYIDLIKEIKKKYKGDIYVLNLYYPLSSRYKKYYNSIKTWNNLLESNKKKGYKILKMDNIMISSKDFINDIEPSEIGSKKIAEEIVKVL